MSELKRWTTTGSLVLALISCLWSAATGQAGQQRAEEERDYYRKWLEEDVVYVISSDEKSVFENLSTPEEKDQFIEQFWLRRDSDPSTSINEFKEEHYRRIAYANETFHSGMAGWRTDRGMIYILFGPPDGMEKHPEGGTYQRKTEEGGGQTYTYPFEVWFYRHLEGVGPGIEIEFVDASRTNEYRIAMDPEQKDALFTVPGAGLTLAEKMGTMSRIDRIRTRWMGNPEGYRRFDSAGRTLRYRDYPLQRLETLSRLQKGPAVKYRDLEELIQTQVSYAELPIRVRTDTLRYSASHQLVPVTIFFDNRDLNFKSVSGTDDLVAAKIAVYGRVETPSGRITYTFEDDIERRLSSSALPHELNRATVYQKLLPLESGRYKLSLVMREAESGKTAITEQLLLVPTPEKDALETSTVIVSPQLTLPLAGESIGDPFVFGKYRVVPAADERFRPEEGSAQAYFEVYNLALDQTTLKPSAKVEISLSGEEGQIFPYTKISRGFEFDGDRLLVYPKIPFEGLKQGKYTLLIRITDEIRQKPIGVSIDFMIESG